jgi:hypothetical protein
MQESALKSSLNCNYDLRVMNADFSYWSNPFYRQGDFCRASRQSGRFCGTIADLSTALSSDETAKSFTQDDEEAAKKTKVPKNNQISTAKHSLVKEVCKDTVAGRLSRPERDER